MRWHALYRAMHLLYMMMFMREMIGKLTKSDKSATGILYIPADLMVDSAFPFKPPESVKVRIDGERLIIEKVQS